MRTNVLEAERRRLEREAARKELHGTYAEAATPKSFTRGTRVYGKIGLGETGEEPKYHSSGGGRGSAGEEERCDQTRARCRRGGFTGGADYDYESRREDSKSPRRRGPAAPPRRRRATRRRGGRTRTASGTDEGTSPTFPRSTSTFPARRRSPRAERRDSAGTSEPGAEPEIFAPEETSAAAADAAKDGFDDENEDPKSEQ